MALEVSRTLGPYDLGEQLGVGGMGFVYRARHRLLEQPRAVKVLQPHLAADETFLRLFYREARLAASLEHPGIVRVFDVGEAEGQHYLAMTLLTGQPLHHLLRAAGPLPPARAARVVRQLADALQYAHDRKVLHRDVKPSNVFVDADDRVTLLDFGIARAMDGTSSSSSVMMGTVAYMAPELFDGKPADSWSDGYGLAILTFELLSGKTPFGDLTPQAMGYAHVHRPPPPLRSRRPELPELAERVISRELSKDPSDRFPSVAAFADALVPALEAAALLGQARTAFDRDDVATAVRLVRQAEAMIAGDAVISELKARLRERHAQMTSHTTVIGLLEAGDWRAAMTELNRVDDGSDINLVSLRAMADALRRSEEARIEADRRAALLEAQLARSSAAAPTERGDGPSTVPGTVPTDRGDDRPTAPATRPTDRGAPAPPARRVVVPPAPHAPTLRGGWPWAAGAGIIALVVVTLIWRTLAAGVAPAAEPVATPTRQVVSAPTSAPTALPTLAQAVTPVAAVPAVPTPAPTAAPTIAPTAPPSPTPGPEQRLQSAQAALDAGHVDEARAIVDELRATAPTLSGLGELVATVHVRHGRTLAEAGRHDEALAAYDVALQARPDDTEALVARKQSTLQKLWSQMEAAWGKDDDAAIRAANELFSIDPDYREIRQKLYALLVAKADRLLASGNRAAAVDVLARAQEIAPPALEARQRLVALTPTASLPPTAVVRQPTPPRQTVSAPGQQQSQPATPTPSRAVQPTRPPAFTPQPTSPAVSPRQRVATPSVAQPSAPIPAAGSAGSQETVGTGTCPNSASFILFDASAPETSRFYLC